MPFLGNQPSTGYSTIVKDDFTANGNDTVFTLSRTAASANSIAVFVGNVRQEPTDAYTVNGTTLTMSAAPANGANFYVLHISGAVENSSVPASGTIGTSQLANNAVTTAKIADDQVTSAKLDTNIAIDGDLTVDTDTLHVDSTNNRVGIGTSSPSNALEVTTDTTDQIRISDVTGDGWEFRAGTNLIFKDDGTERMRISSSGKVGIGTSNPSSLLEVHGDTPDIRIANTAETETKIVFYDFQSALQSAGISYNCQNNALTFFNDTATNYGGTERMRINSSGNVLVGTTSVPSVGVRGLAMRDNTRAIETLYSSDTTASSNMIRFQNPLGSIGSITVVASTTSYNTASDYRLKEDWQPMSGSIDRVKALNPVNFAWKVDGSRVDGFLAHEAQEVVPEAVTGTKDAVDAEGNPEYQGIDQSKLVPLLTAALQEALAKIESLEARVSALESN